MKTYVTRTIAAYLLWTVASASATADQQPYIESWVPELTQCRVIDAQLLEGGGDHYLIAECDTKNPKERTTRIWRTRYEPNKPAKMLEVQIHGEAILPWQRVTGLFSKGLNENGYWLVKCREKIQLQEIPDDQFSAAGLIKIGSTKATLKNGLLYFKQGQQGTIEAVPFSKIAKCSIPDP